MLHDLKKMKNYDLFDSLSVSEDIDIFGNHDITYLIYICNYF